MLRIDSVSKSYSKGEVRAVDDLTLHVQAGEIFGFLGPNGAGKTTMIKMIVGLLAPDGGRVLVNGHDILKEPVAAKACIGYVPDNPDLFDKLTGVEYLSFMGDVYGVAADVRRQRVELLLAMFELEDAVGDLIGSYSHGMKQKLALSGALLSKPRVLVLDEPMLGLDPKSSHLFKDLMNRHCEEGGTVFFSTHVLEVAERLCHRVGIIDHGRLIACDTMEGLKSQAVLGSDDASGKSLEDLFLELTEAEER